MIEVGVIKMEQIQLVILTCELRIASQATHMAVFYGVEKFTGRT
jgi:hypothetical protein